LYLAYNTVKLLIQCATGAFVFVTTCIATMILCIAREWILGMVATGTLLSPGLLLMGAIYREAGGVMRDTMFAHIAALVPGVLIDVAIYTAVFFGLAKLARMLVLKRAVPCQPTTDDGRPETAL
jgi:hypothetical protein